MKHFRITWSLLDSSSKKKFSFIVFLFIILSFLEVIGIAAVIPFVTLIFNPSSLNSIYFLNNFVGFFENNKDILLPIFCLIFFLIFLFKNIFYILTYKFVNKFVNNYKAIITTRLIKKYFAQDYLFFVKNSQGRLASILANETQNFSNQFLLSFMTFLSELIILIAIFILIVITGHVEGLLFIVPIFLFAGFIIKLLNRKIKTWSYTRVEVAQDTATLTQRIFLGVRDIFLSNNANILINKFHSLLKNQGLLDSKNATIQLFPKALLEISAIVILLSVMLYFNQIGLSEDLILSNLTFYFVIAYRAIPSYNKILIQFQRFRYAKNSAEIINSELSLKDQRILNISQDEKVPFKKNIKFEQVCFSYDDKQFIKNLDLEIKKGEIIGIYGESGSGKSTLLNLLTFLLNPNEGSIFLDDNLIETELNKRKFQNMITFISQDTFLIEDTIKKNITFNSETELDEKKLNYVLKFSKVDKFIDEFSEGLDYMVGSHSRRISSGQRQRIAIARAIYNLKDILGDGDETFEITDNYVNQENSNSFNTRKPVYLRLGFSKTWEDQVIMAADLVTGFSDNYGSSANWKASIGFEILRFKGSLLRFGYSLGGITKKSLSLGYGLELGAFKIDFGFFS